MVLRKPYAFLIRNFKLIHFILAILMGVFFSKLRSIADFFKEYIDQGIYGKVYNAVSDNIGAIGIILPVIIIGVLILIAYILNMKQKPIRFYIIGIITYIVEIILLIIASFILNSIQHGSVSITLIDIFYDFFNIISYIPVVFIVITLARAVGFNIKQFNFKKDLMELNISEEDSEEFELEVDVDTEDIKAKINRKLRFIKYVYLENKIVFISGAIILVIGLAFGIYSYISSMEKIYDEGYSFTAYGLEVTLNKSYKTKYATNGKLIDKNRFFIIVDFTIKNNYETDQVLPYEYIYLRLDELEKISPTNDYKDEFSDFGLRYVENNKIKAKESRQVILVYEISNKYEKNNFRLEYLLSKINEDETTGSYKYSKIDLKPIEFNEVKQVSSKKLGEELEFKNSLIEGTKIKIDEVNIENKFNYKYTQVIGGQEREFTKTIVPSDSSAYKKAVLQLKVTISKNKNLNEKVYTSLYEKFATIEYEKDGKVYRQKTFIIDLTPNNSNETYLEIVSEAKDSEKVTLVFTIRDKEYKYLLIDNTEKKEEK